MSQAHANAAARGFGNDFGRALQFGSDGHHANAAAGGLPESLEQGEGRSQQVFWRMYSSARMADEWSLQMDSERESPMLAVLTIIILLLALTLFDRIRQPFEGTQSIIHRSGDGGWEVTRDPVSSEQFFNRRKRVGGIVHDVKSGAAMN